MKRKAFLIVLLPLVLLTSCQQTSSLTTNKPTTTSPSVTTTTTEAKVDYNKALASLKSGVLVNATATLSHKYPADYSNMDSSSTISFKQYYGEVEKDGKSVRGVKTYDSNGNPSKIYLEGSNGSTTFETLLKDNTVSTTTLVNGAMNIRFNDRYLNPWDYVSEEDFNGTSLNADKASLISETYLGASFGVKEAKVTFDKESNLTSLTITYPSRKDAVDTGTSQIVYDTTLTSTITFDYSSDKIDLVQPSTNSNPELKAAFESLGSNYTILTFSDASNSVVTTYVTSDGIYQHFGTESRMVEGDYFYKNGKLKTYGSDAATGEIGFTNEVSASLSSVLPTFDQISDALFNKENSSTYTLLSDATYANCASFASAYFDFGSEYNGNFATITLKDKKVATAATSVTLNTGTVVNVRNTYSNYGSTAFPAYFSLN